MLFRQQEDLKTARSRSLIRREALAKCFRLSESLQLSKQTPSKQKWTNEIEKKEEGEWIWRPTTAKTSSVVMTSRTFPDNDRHLFHSIIPSIPSTNIMFGNTIYDHTTNETTYSTPQSTTVTRSRASQHIALSLYRSQARNILSAGRFKQKGELRKPWCRYTKKFI